MRKAYYMQFLEGHDGGRLDRLGGLPTHLPAKIPRFTTYDGKEKNEFALLAQFYCTTDRLYLPDTLCIQLWQDPDVGEGGDPLPVAIRVPVTANENTERLGVIHPDVLPHEISFELRDDPYVFPDSREAYVTDEEKALMQSKIGGVPYYTDDELPPEHIFLFQLYEGPGGCNFAGRHAMVTLAPTGDLHVRLQ
jgi:hypothetical protein